MFKDKALRVKSLINLGKSLILALAISSSALANDKFNPVFFEYTSNSFTNRVVEFSFGWFKKLDSEQLTVYHQSIAHALNYAENNEKVRWYKNNASGYSVPVVTWPVSNGYCRQIHLSVIAYNKQKSTSGTACYNKLDSNWTWYSDK